MLGAIGGLTPEYRGADIRCGLNERLGCGTRTKPLSRYWRLWRVTRTDVIGVDFAN